LLFALFYIPRGERQALRAAHELANLIQGESLFTYCSPYKRAKETWEIISNYIQEGENIDLIGMREEPRVAEQQFGNFREYHCRTVLHNV
jgi:broad specificity phosphatase PhoE